MQGGGEWVPSGCDARKGIAHKGKGTTMKTTPRVYVSNRISRRDFLRLSGLVAGMGGMAVLSGCGPASQDAGSEEAPETEETAE